MVRVGDRHHLRLQDGNKLELQGGQMGDLVSKKRILTFLLAVQLEDTFIVLMVEVCGDLSLVWYLKRITQRVNTKGAHETRNTSGQGCHLGHELVFRKRVALEEFHQLVIGSPVTVVEILRCLVQDVVDVLPGLVWDGNLPVTNRFLL